MTLPELMGRSIDGVLAMDSRQRVIFWNQACETLTGIPAGEALGRGCHEVMQGLDPMGRPLCGGDCPVGRLSRGGPPPGHLPMRIAHRDGRRMQLCVGTLLMPSCKADEWTVVHVLSRDCGDSLLDAPRQESAKADADVAPGDARRDLCLLTRREREMLVMLAQGLKTECIARECHLSVTTVRNHIQRMMAKLDVHTQLEAAAYAHRHGLLA